MIEILIIVSLCFGLDGCDLNLEKLSKSERQLIDNYFQHQYRHPVNKITGDGKVDKLVILKSPSGKQNDVELGELSFFEQLTLKHFLHEAIF